MDKQEFLLLIPAIIYGVAIVDLLKIFNHKKRYIEVLAWGLFIMIAVIFTWIELFNKLDSVTNNNVSFFMIIFQAVLFARASAIITPETEDLNNEEYFMGVRKRFFLLLAIITAYGMLMRYFIFDDHVVLWFRPLLIVFYLIGAYSNKYWLRISIVSLILILSIVRIFTGALN